MNKFERYHYKNQSALDQVLAQHQNRSVQPVRYSTGQENITPWNAKKPANLQIYRAPKSVPNYAAQARRDTFGGILGAASTLATVGASTVAGASLAPVAVGLGLGYGAYKLGEAVGLF